MGHWLLTDALAAQAGRRQEPVPLPVGGPQGPLRARPGRPAAHRPAARGHRRRLPVAAGPVGPAPRAAGAGPGLADQRADLGLQLRGQRPLGLDLLEWQGLLRADPGRWGRGVDRSRSDVGCCTSSRKSLPERPGRPAGRDAAAGAGGDGATEQRKAGPDQREAVDRAELADRLAVDTDAGRGADAAVPARFRPQAASCAQQPAEAPPAGRGSRRDPAPDGTPEPEPEPVRTVELPSGPEGQAGAAFQPRTEGHSLEDEDSVAGGFPSSAGLDPSFILESELRTSAVLLGAAEPASAGIAAPARAVAEPASHPIPQDEPGPAVVRCPPSVVRCWGGEGISQNEPGPPTHGDETPQYEPTTLAAGDQMPQNEPSPPAGGDPISEHEPTGSGRIARLGVPALILALAILPAARLSAAFAGRIGKPDVPADGKSGPGAAKVNTDRPCPFESAYRGHSPQLKRLTNGLHTTYAPAPILKR